MSPRREGGYERIELAPAEERIGRRCQELWYRYLADTIPAGQSILDVGCGDGYGVDILRAKWHDAHGQDIAPVGDKAGEIDRIGVEFYGPNRYDVVLAVDVLEHVEDDREFLFHLMRIARRTVFFSTPNWEHSKCANKYHVREYTRAELEDLLRFLDYEVLEMGTGFGVWINNKGQVER